MAEKNNACPKCGAATGDTSPKYCPGPTLTQHCPHNLRAEHLYQECACGFHLNVRPCADAPKEPEHV
jgi:hypothetical protein